MLSALKSGDTFPRESRRKQRVRVEEDEDILNGACCLGGAGGGNTGGMGAHLTRWRGAHWTRTDFGV